MSRISYGLPELLVDSMSVSALAIGGYAIVALVQLPAAPTAESLKAAAISWSGSNPVVCKKLSGRIEISPERPITFDKEYVRAMIANGTCTPK